MDQNIAISLVSGLAAIAVAWLTTRNKASRSEVDSLREELKHCKEQNLIEREEERKIRAEITSQLKSSIEEANELRRRNQELLDENMMLMKKYIFRETNPKIKRGKK